MENAVIVGTYQFIGFHLCRSLLEDGETVYGVSYPNLKLEDSEDKQLEIGRNANYEEIGWEEKFKGNSGKIIYDCYDILNSDKIISQIKNDLHIESNIQDLTDRKHELIFLGNVLDFTRHEEELFPMLKSIGIPFRFIYYPTVYGPWQPKEFLFVQLLEDCNDIELSELEYKEDAIFIDDAAAATKKLMMETSTACLFLTSGIKNHWMHGKKAIKEFPVKIPRYQIPSCLQSYTVDNKNNIADNLEMQRRHIKMYKW
ncbi:MULTISPECIES: hypothetical protein [Bacillaceae]|uniref:hypothetical protein n=1 Tax=Bacillaceae TaxID=186817 RepID=UPI001E497957|nr:MULTISPECIES: hypothetical protein [Bacillaceae]MCE4050457.1 hypothetical protein [Bacillus sp. Au-Bac7]MCM3030478.1 hypothetical protein [Niallia sp. MER 6]